MRACAGSRCAPWLPVLEKRQLQSIKTPVRVPLRMPVNSERACGAVPVLIPCIAPLLRRIWERAISPLLALHGLTSLEIINRAEGWSDARRVSGSPRAHGSGNEPYILPLTRDFPLQAPYISAGCVGKDGWSLRPPR